MKKEKYKIGKLVFSTFAFWYEGKYESYFSTYNWTLYSKEKALKIASEFQKEEPDVKYFIKNFNNGEITWLKRNNH